MKLSSALLTLLLLFTQFTPSVTFAQKKASHTPPPQKLVIATWNVENLFDTEVNQPNRRDEEFTPQSWRRWTPERYETKLTNLAWVIHQMQPDILCVTEVENRGVLEQLNQRLQEIHGWSFAAIAHEDSSDYRGIDNAILSRFPIKKQRLFRFNNRRGALFATIDVPQAPITVVANHWKSQSGDTKENNQLRANEADATRKVILKHLKQDPSLSLVIAGDFNVDHDDPCMQDTFLATVNKNKSYSSPRENPIFYNLIGDIPEKERGSYFYARHKNWHTYDAIMVQPEMLKGPEAPGPSWRTSPSKARATYVFALKEMRELGDGRPKAYRRVRIKGKPANYYVEGYADHFPIITTLRRAH